MLGCSVRSMVVVCKIATLSAIEDLRLRVGVRGRAVDVMGVVGPESNLAAARTRNSHIGLLATPRMVASGAYDRAVLAADPLVLVRRTSAPGPLPALVDQTGAPITEGGHSFSCTGEVGAFAQIGARLLRPLMENTALEGDVAPAGPAVTRDYARCSCCS
jgi:hypothetical protein